MPNVKGLLADPQFNSLDSATQKAVLAGIDPQFGGISDSDFATFRQSVGSTAPTLRMPTPPTRFDKFVSGVTGNLGASDNPQDPIQQLVQGVGSSLGRTTQAWRDLFTGNANSSTLPEMVPLLGPAAVDASRMLATPGQRWQGAGAATALLAPEMLHAMPEMPGLPLPSASSVGTRTMSAIKAGGADMAKGSGKFAAGVAVSKVLPHEAQIALGYPMYQGAKQAGSGLVKAYNAFKETPFEDRLAAMGEPEPRPAYQPLPALPDLKQDSAALPSDGLPSKRQVGGLQNVPPPLPPIVRVPGGVIPDRPADASPIVPWSPPEATPAPLSAPVELPSGRKPGGIQNQTAGAPLAPATSDIAGIHPMDLEAAASLMSNGKKAFADLKGPARAEAITRARQFTTNRSPASPVPLAPIAAQPATSPVLPTIQNSAQPSAGLPASNPVIAPDLAPPLSEPSTPVTPIERQLQASLLATKMEPITPIGNNIVYPDNVHPQLHPAGPDVAITHATNASAKDLAVARRLQGAGITPEALDRMSDDALNQHYTALGYKKLGSDFKPGKRVGRDAATGRAHLRQVLGEMGGRERR